MGSSMSYFLDFGEFDLSYMVDLHVEVGDFEGAVTACARSAKAAGMRALLLRGQDGSTTALAQRVSAGVGTIILAGGFRPSTTPLAAAVIEAELAEGTQLFDLSANRAAVFEGADLRDEIHAIFEILRDRVAILTTGSLGDRETILLVKAAKRTGLSRLLVPAQHLDSIVQSDLVGEGIFFEWTLAGLHYPADPVQMQAMADGMRKAGVAASVLSSGLEPGGAVDPVDAMSHYLAALAAQGLSVRDLKEMAKKNPAFLLGLPERVVRKPDK
jgi:hypothetical protein